MPETLRNTTAMRMVLAALLGADGDVWGYEICRATGLPSGTAYPILARLRKRGWATAHWENTGPSETLGRPPRRYWTLAEDGRTAALATIGADTAAAPLP